MIYSHSPSLLLLFLKDNLFVTNWKYIHTQYFVWFLTINVLRIKFSATFCTSKQITMKSPWNKWICVLWAFNECSKTYSVPNMRETRKNTHAKNIDRICNIACPVYLWILIALHRLLLSCLRETKVAKNDLRFTFLKNRIPATCIRKEKASIFRHWLFSKQLHRNESAAAVIMFTCILYCNYLSLFLSYIFGEFFIVYYKFEMIWSWNW